MRCVWSPAENGLLPPLASTGWPERGVGTPKGSRRPEAAGGKLFRNTEMVANAMIIVNLSVESRLWRRKQIPSPTGC